MRRIAIFALLLLAGCGGGAPSEVVPADATIYVGLDASRVERRLMPVTSRADVDFERDVEPWLGERAAYFARADDEYGLVFDAEDEDAAEAFGRKVTAGGPLRASAIVDGRLVIASSRDLLRAAAAADAGSLADSARLDVTGEDGDEVPDVLLATEDPHAFAEGLELYDIRPEELQLPPLGDGPFTARVRDGRVELEGLAPVDDVIPSLADATGAATFAFASADLGADLPLVRDLAGVDLDLPALGAGTLVVQGDGVRVIAETGDEAGLREQAGKRDLEVGDGHVRLVIGPEPGGVAEDLGDTKRYRDAERRLGGPPTLLTGSLAARRDGETLVIVGRAGD
jgi:hypothetical protein